MMKRPLVLVLDDDPHFRELVAKLLQNDYDTRLLADAAELPDALIGSPAALLLDICLNPADERDRSGLDILSRLRTEAPHLPVIVVTAYADDKTAQAIVGRGAAYFLTKPVNGAALMALLGNAIARAPLERALAVTREEFDRTQEWDMVGDSPAIRAVRKVMEMAAVDGNVSVLIEGATGTGKELVARGIHRQGVRKNRPFVAVNLSAIPETLVEAELFGNERGAFTGAEKRRIGHIERADGGILFLDEIGDLKEGVQVKILRFLEERRFFRVGGRDEISVDIQLLAATNKNLQVEIKAKRFRDDLYFRLKTLPIFLPPLNERKEDIPSITEIFLRKEGDRRGVKSIAKDALDALVAHTWPGNARELRSAIEHGILIAAGRGSAVIEPADLPLDVARGKHSSIPLLPPDADWPLDIDRHMAGIELALIEEALRRANGKKAGAWRILGLNDRFALRRRVIALMKKVRVK